MFGLFKEILIPTQAKTGGNLLVVRLLPGFMVGWFKPSLHTGTPKESAHNHQRYAT